MIQKQDVNLLAHSSSALPLLRTRLGSRLRSTSSFRDFSRRSFGSRGFAARDGEVSACIICGLGKGTDADEALGDCARGRSL